VRSDALAVDGDTVAIDGTLFTVCPWWDGPHTRVDVERMLERAEEQRRGRWVWVYHAPPKGLLSWTGKRHYGDSVLPELIRRFSPTAVLCGHIHEAPFQIGGSWIDRVGETWLFNAGRQIGDVPARVEIDFAQQAARWISLAGVDERRL
jgi:Icc-related predicted phosphoesterase